MESFIRLAKGSLCFLKKEEKDVTNVEGVNEKHELITLNEDGELVSLKSKKVKEVASRVTFNELMREMDSKLPLGSLVTMQRSQGKLATKIKKRELSTKKKKVIRMMKR